MLRKKKTLALSVLSLLSTFAFSANAESLNKSSYVIVAPTCLLKNISTDYQTLSKTKQHALIKINETGFNQLISAKNQQKSACGGFMNVTDAWNGNETLQRSPRNFLKTYTTSVMTSKAVKSNYAVNHPKEVKQLLSLLNPQNMWSNLTTLSGFHDRYANSDNGVQAANWIKSQIEQLAKEHGRNDVKVYFINTGSSYKQPSVVAKIGTSDEPGIVIGGHMDTLSPWIGNMPGADDDGTGSVTVLETARTLLASNMHFKKPIYLIWYSAEEMGLVGSQYVVSEFKKQNIPVAEVIHFDMTGYAPNNDMTMWLMTDYTNKDLTAFLATLINTYVKQPIKYSACGYACSDHATWTQNGYRAAIAFESDMSSYNPYIHTAQDTMDQLSLAHMTDYAKLAIAFVVETAEPIA